MMGRKLTSVPNENIVNIINNSKSIIRLCRKILAMKLDDKFDEKELNDFNISLMEFDNDIYDIYDSLRDYLGVTK